MATLTIRAAENIGPLTLRIVTAEGRQVLPTPAPLTSSNRMVQVRDLDQGSYVILGTRPSGQTLVQSVKVAGNAAEAEFGSSDVPDGGFLAEATARGYAATLSAGTAPTFVQSNILGNRAPPASSDADRALNAIIGAGRIELGPPLQLDLQVRPSASTALTVLTTSILTSAKRGPVLPWPTGRTYALRRWTWCEGRWRRDLQHADELESVADWNSGFVRIRVEPAYGDRPIRAYGLVDHDGYGPILIVPPFRRGVDVAFLADGVAAEAAADRAQNPSLAKVPVAVVLPLDPVVADLLGAVASASMPGAEQVLSGSPGLGDVDHALEVLFHKYEDPAAAMLGAHFLVRFMPKRVPVAWMENLIRLMPDVADGPTLLAWRYILAGGKQGAEVERKEIQRLFRVASRRSIHLFARSRSLLNQGMRQYGPWSRSRQVAASATRRARPGDFLDVAGDAGGIEAFWGSSPTRPWRHEGSSSWSTPPILQVQLERGAFAAAGFQPRV